MKIFVKYIFAVLAVSYSISLMADELSEKFAELAVRASKLTVQSSTREKLDEEFEDLMDLNSFAKPELVILTGEKYHKEQLLARYIETNSDTRKIYEIDLQMISGFRLPELRAYFSALEIRDHDIESIVVLKGLDELLDVSKWDEDQESEKKRKIVLNILTTDFSNISFVSLFQDFNKKHLKEKSEEWADVVQKFAVSTPSFEESKGDINKLNEAFSKEFEFEISQDFLNYAIEMTEKVEFSKAKYKKLSKLAYLEKTKELIRAAYQVAAKNQEVVIEDLKKIFYKKIMGKDLLELKEAKVGEVGVEGRNQYFIEDLEVPKNLDKRISWDQLSKKIGDNAVLSNSKLVSYCDEVIQESGKIPNHIGRETQIKEILDVLGNDSFKGFSLKGGAGSGRSGVMTALCLESIKSRTTIDSEFVQNQLDDLIVVQLEMTNDIKVLEAMLKSINEAASSNDAPNMIVYLKNFDDFVKNESINLNGATMVAFKQMLEQSDFKFKIAFHADEESHTKFESYDKSGTIFSVEVPPLGNEEIAKILANRHAKKTNGITFENPDLLKLIAHYGVRFYSNKSKMNAAIALYNTVMNRMSKSTGHDGVVTREWFFELLRERLHRVFDVFNEEELLKERDALEKYLKLFTISQDRYIKDLVRFVYNQWLGLKEAKRGLLVMGPTGTGKTSTLKKLAKYLFGSEDKMFLLPMNQFTTDRNLKVSELFGAAKSTGATDRGPLIKWITGEGRGGSVIVFDEVDKAADVFFDQIHTVVGDGYILDNAGNRVYLDGHILVFTSNRGTEILFPEHFQKLTREERIEKVLGISEVAAKDAYKKPTQKEKNSTSTQETGGTMRDETMGRLTISITGPIAIEDAPAVAKLQIDPIVKDVESSKNFFIHIDQALINMMAYSSYSYTYGAREIVNSVVNYLGEELPTIRSRLELEENDHLLVTFENTENTLGTSIVFEKVTIREGAEITDYGDYAIEDMVLTGKRLQKDGPRRRIDNPFQDEELLQSLSKVADHMFLEIPYQSDVVETLETAIYENKLTREANFLATHETMPMFVIMEGDSYYQQKLVMEKYSKAMTGSESYVYEIDLSQITSTTDLMEIFGAGTGIQGAGEVRAFERILQQTPDFGVIIFKNMHLLSPAIKKEVLQKVYVETNKSSWSQKGGDSSDRYEMGNKTIVFSGLHIAQEMGADDYMKENGYKRNKEDIAGLSRKLISNQVPAELVGNSNILVTKPLTNKELTENYLDRWISEVFTQHTSVFKDLVFENENHQELILKSYLSEQLGVEGLKKFIKERGFGAALAQARAKLVRNKKYEKGKKYIARVKFNDTGDPFARFAPDEFEVRKSRTASIEVSIIEVPEELESKEVSQVEAGQEIIVSSKVNTSQFISNKTLYRKEDVLFTAYHEAAHAIVGEFLLQAEDVDLLSIVPGGMYLGYMSALSDPEYGVRSSNEEVLKKMATFYAGRVGEYLNFARAGSGFGGGPQSDLWFIKKDAAFLCIKAGYCPDSLAADMEKESFSADSYEAKGMLHYMRVAEMMAIDTLSMHKHLSDYIVSIILDESQKGLIEKDKWREIIDTYKGDGDMNPRSVLQRLYPEADDCAKALMF